MREFSLPVPFGLGTTGKLFSKIYNVFYCSKKTETPVADEADESGQLKAEWFDAVKGQDAAKMDELLAKGISVNTVDENGWMALHLAAWNGYKDICENLVKQNCEVNTGETSPVSLAAQKGHLDIVKILLSANCDIHSTTRLGECMDVTALHIAAQNGHADIVRLLLEAGAVVNATMLVRGIKGVTPLHLAVEAGHLDVMDILIEAGCDVHSSTQDSCETSC